MIPFIILIFILILQGLHMSSTGQKYRKPYIILALIEIVFIAGFRLPVDEASDTYAYTLMYREIAGVTKFVDLLDFGYEIGFYTFCWLLSKISKDPQLLIFASSLFMVGCVLKFIYTHSKDVWLSVVLYITMMHFFFALNGMRFAMACSVLLYATDYIVNRKALKFFLVVVLAMSLHFTAIVYVIAYFLYPFKLDKKRMFFIAIPFYLVSKFFVSVFNILIMLNPRYVSYDSGQGEFYQSSFANILIFILNLYFFYIVCKKERIPLEKLQGVNKYYMIACYVTVLFSLMAIDVMMITRFVTMFSIFFIVYIPNLLKQNCSKIVYKRWVTTLLIITIAQVIVILTYRPEWYLVTPYRNFLFN